MDELLLAYGPQPSFDDMAWYGLAYARIYEVLGKKNFLALSREIFDWVWREGWDTSVCGGGVWFDQVSYNKYQVGWCCDNKYHLDSWGKADYRERADVPVGKQASKDPQQHRV